MVEDVPHPELLPGGKKKGPLTDTANYRDLWYAAENLISQCLIHRGQMGWQAAGMSLIIHPPTPLFINHAGLETAIFERISKLLYSLCVVFCGYG